MASRTPNTATRLMNQLGADPATTKLKRELDRIADQANRALTTLTQIDTILASIPATHPHHAEITTLANIYLRDVKAHHVTLTALNTQRQEVQQLTNPDDMYLPSIALSENYLEWTSSLQTVVLPVSQQIIELVQQSGN